MDIVSRLKRFMDAQGLTNSLFADTCGIPRPTMSQILTGRNKKVSDELIAKIHQGFPSLNILWLMFGEGSMDSAANNAVSEPQNATKLVFEPRQEIDTRLFEDEESSLEIFSNSPSEKSEAPKSVSTASFEANTPSTNLPPHSAIPENVAKTINGAVDRSTGKRITSIVVFYADNTFETFNPAP